ncbi:nitronate monooxygenase [Siccirubricoccus deserti]
MTDARSRAAAFCSRHDLRVPILQAPMAGACPPPLAAAVASAGGMGGFGALMSSPAAMADWVASFRSRSNGAFQINLWIPDPARSATRRMRHGCGRGWSGWPASPCRTPAPAPSSRISPPSWRHC